MIQIFKNPKSRILYLLETGEEHLFLITTSDSQKLGCHYLIQFSIPTQKSFPVDTVVKLLSPPKRTISKKQTIASSFHIIKL